MRVKAASVSSLAYRPRMLVLDEPFSGLDPVVRDDLVQGVLELAGQEQWTVVLSSHDLDEVERLVDIVGFLDAGQLVLCEPFADLHARFRRIEVTLDGDGPAEPPANAGGVPHSWIGIQRAGRVVRVIDTGYNDSASEHRAQSIWPAIRVEAFPMTL